MTTRARLVVLFVALVATGASPAAVQVKETAKLTISGPGLAPSIEVTEPAVLALSNVFAGAFIGSRTSIPDAGWPRYTVAFDVQTRGGVKHAAYVVTYTKNRWTGEGFIYLPGHGENWYRSNISTILRDDDDGKWHRAAAAWGQAINARLP